MQQGGWTRLTAGRADVADRFARVKGAGFGVRLVYYQRVRAKEALALCFDPVGSMESSVSLHQARMCGRKS